jgi:hypothetical protein
MPSDGIAPSTVLPYLIAATDLTWAQLQAGCKQEGYSAHVQVWSLQPRLGRS